MWWPFKKKEEQKTIENTDIEVENTDIEVKPEKKVWSQEDIVQEADEMLHPKEGFLYSYHPHVWAMFIVEADKQLKELEEENKDLKQRLTEYKQELASYHL